jgi:glycosyltransferase involved in cell wall biosynthesis
LGTRRGALPEIVSPESGLLGDSVDELVSLRPGIARLDSEACRGRVLSMFTHRTMAESYLALYREVVGSGRIVGKPVSR